MGWGAANFNDLVGVFGVATRGQRAFNLLTGAAHLDTSNLVQQTIDHLQQKINELQQMEEDFKAAFECSSLEEFEQRVANYYNNKNLTRFSGSNLQKIINDFKTQLDEQDMELQRRFNELFNAFLNDYIQNELSQDWIDALQGKEVTAAITSEIITEFVHMLNSIKGGGGLQFSAQAKRLTSNTQGALELVAKRGTKAFRDYIDIAYNKAIQGSALTYKDTKGQKRQIQFTNQTHSSKYEVDSTFAIKWANIIRASGTKMLTPSEIQKRIDNKELTPRDISNKNRELINLICSELNVSGEYLTFVKQRLQTMLQKDPFMFFVGNSYTNLEGILGEINAVVAITHLLGSKYTNKALHWIGSQPGVYSKKQPSIDIVVDNILGIEKAQFGIQVKNTIEELNTDLSHYINFADRDIDLILRNIGVQSDDIKNVYISDTYNVPYKHIGRRYVQVGAGTRFEHESRARFDRFIQIEELIDNLVNDINIYLARFASDFIYMQNPDFPTVLAKLDNEVINTHTTGNFCYIVGTKVFFANKMLQDLQVQLDILQSLKRKELQADLQFETYFKEKGGSNTSYNIVAYKNNHDNTLSNYTLKMRSSWGFHK